MQDHELDRLLRSVNMPEAPDDLAERIVARATLLPQQKRAPSWVGSLATLFGTPSRRILSPALCSLVLVIAFSVGMQQGYEQAAQEEEASFALLDETEMGA